MKTRLFASLALAAIALFAFRSAAVSTSWQFHTPPDQWKEPRNFQTPMEKEYENRLSFSHQPIPEKIDAKKHYSPNNAYWFAIQEISPQEPILIFNERDYLISIDPIVKDPDYPIKNEKAKWINEKLLYIEIWWGRVLGTCYIYDVEKESIIYQEMVNDGVIPFQQY